MSVTVGSLGIPISEMMVPRRDVRIRHVEELKPPPNDMPFQGRCPILAVYKSFLVLGVYEGPVSQDVVDQEYPLGPCHKEEVTIAVGWEISCFGVKLGACDVMFNVPSIMFLPNVKPCGRTGHARAGCPRTAPGFIASFVSTTP